MWKTVALSVVAGVVLGYALAAVRVWDRPDITAPVGSSAPQLTPEHLQPDSHGPSSGAAQATGRRTSGGSISEVLALGDSFSRTAALYALAGSVDVPALKNYIGEAMGIESARDRQIALGILFQRYAALDPAGALQHLGSLHVAGEAALATMIFHAWAESDLPAALAAIHQLNDPRAVQLAGNALLAAYRDRDPETVDRILSALPPVFDTAGTQIEQLAAQAATAPREALETALQLDDPRHRDEAVQKIAHAWAVLDPPAAFAHGQTLADARAQRSFLQQVIEHWAGVDPDGALTAIVEMPPGPMRHPLRRTALSQLLRRDPAHALTWAGQLESGSSYTGYTQFVMNSWARADVGAALRQLPRLSGEVRRKVIPTLAQEYARTSAATALGWADGLENAEDRAQALAAVATTVAERDPDLALGYVLGLKPSLERTQALGALVRTLSEGGNAAKAAGVIAELPAGQTRLMAVGSVTHHWALRDVSAALAWSRQLEGHEREQALSTVMMTWAQLDLPAATRQLAQLSGAERSAALSSVASVYGGRDPKAALDWLERFDGEPGYENALFSVVSQWAEHDPPTAIDYLRDHAESESEQTYVRQLVSEWARRAPLDAAEWVEDLPDDAIREHAAESVISWLAQVDLEQAADWAEGWSAGPARDRAMVTLAWQTNTLDDRVRWANTIQSAETRSETAADLARSFDDPADAQRFLNRVSLTPAQRAGIEAMLRERNRE